jgi:hypothetical protein
MSGINDIRPYLLAKSLQRTFTVAHAMSFKVEHLLIPGLLFKFILVLLWQCHCPTTAYLASIELTASFLSRYDAEVEAQQGHQYMMAHAPLVIQYVRENSEPDNRVIFVTW